MSVNRRSVLKLHKIPFKTEQQVIPPSELRSIINHVVGRYVRREDCTPEQQSQIQDMMQQRETGMPLAKIIGYKEFWKDKFITNIHTLDPRPDSETMIEAVLETCPKAPYRMLDLGTGTGCLLLSLLREYPDATGVGVDISAEALAVARQNGESLGLANRVTWIQSHWCENVSGDFDIIISNPPYIGRDEPINKGATFDPALALYGGIETYEDILKSLHNNCCLVGPHPRFHGDPHESGDRDDASKYHLFLEVGYKQAPAVSALLIQYDYTSITIKKDLSKHDRILISFGLK